MASRTASWPPTPRASSGAWGRSAPDAAHADTAGPYQVLARKYRPGHFRDLIGQEAMVQTLTNAWLYAALALSLTHILDNRSIATAAATRNREDGRQSGYESVQLQRNLPDGPGLGYQVSAERGVFDRYAAQAAWQTDHAVLSAGVARAGHNSDARVGASGGMAWLGDSVFLSRRIDGSFAVVEVADYPGVTLLHDNRPVTRTDSRGRALVSGLRGYEANRIGIDPADLPMDADVDALEALLTPPARSGVALRLGVERVRSASFRLVGADGKALPAGSVLRVAGQSRSFPVGFDGKAFASGLAGRTRVLARWPGHECSTWLPAIDPGDEVPELGTLRCE